MTAFDKAWSLMKESRFPWGAPDYHTINRPSKPVVHIEGKGGGYVDPNIEEDGLDYEQLRSKTSMAKPLHLDRLVDSGDPNNPYAHLNADVRQHLIGEMERDVVAGKPRYAMRMPRPDEEEETEQRRQELLAGE
tara:strand:+ start:371 stop:772 length:402 start_codon:yes stop_codon:yes gene_type:complete